MKVFIGIDNGTSGSIGIVSAHKAEFHHTPTKRELSYTKKKKWINRIDSDRLFAILEPYKNKAAVYLERPMVNPMRFNATVSALRALEATLVVVERLSMPVQYVDSKEWQRAMLPAGLQKDELKKASLDIGRRFFPHLASLFKKDADGLLMAEWARRNYS